MLGPSAPNSDSTSDTLLERAQACDPEAWNRLSLLYAPLVYRWARAAGLQASDAADVGQEVFRVVAAKLEDFHRVRPDDGFRKWLWGVTQNKLREFYRRLTNGPQATGGSAAHEQLQQFSSTISFVEFDPSPSENDIIVKRTLELIRGEFADHIWQAFWRVTIDERKAPEVAAELQMSNAAVRQAKCRVLRRLKQELKGLL